MGTILFIIIFCGVFCTPTSTAKRHALIWLHGLGGNQHVDMQKLYRTVQHLAESVEIATPAAPTQRHSLYSQFGLGHISVPSWFDFTLMPADAVVSPTPGAVPQEVAAASRRVDSIIEEFIGQGIPSENIVVAGMSQGGALALYHSVHSKHKVGGYIPIVTWMPNLLADPPTDYSPVNRNTPILQLNGGADHIVPASAGLSTREVMRKVFTKYTYETVPLTTHTTTHLVTLKRQKRWLQDNNLLEFRRSELGGIIGAVGRIFHDGISRLLSHHVR